MEEEKEERDDDEEEDRSVRACAGLIISVSDAACEIVPLT